MRRGLIGLGWRPGLAAWIDSGAPEIECLEITAEHFYDGNLDYLRRLGRRLPLYVHGLGLSLGTPGPLDQGQLSRFLAVARAASARWVSEHIAFTRSGDLDLGHLNPVPLTRESLATMTEHAVELREQSGRPVILENITSHLQLPGELEETDFLMRLCENAGCGLLLDVTNLHINSVNHGFDAYAWLQRLDPQHIVQLHIVGYAARDGRLQDSHSATIQPELLDLLEAVLQFAPVEAVILERDEATPDTTNIRTELQRLRGAVSSA
jgi:uncharacterized protein (UPF0276 family)